MKVCMQRWGADRRIVAVWVSPRLQTHTITAAGSALCVSMHGTLHHCAQCDRW
jgi:hypothetical protein